MADRPRARLASVRGWRRADQASPAPNSAYGVLIVLASPSSSPASRPRRESTFRISRRADAPAAAASTSL